MCSSHLAKRSEHTKLVSPSYLLPGVAAERLSLVVFQVKIPNSNKKEGQSWHCSCASAYLYPAVIYNQTLCCVVYNGLDAKVLSQSLAARLMLQTSSVGGGRRPMLLCNLSRISIWPGMLTPDYSTSSRSCLDFPGTTEPPLTCLWREARHKNPYSSKVRTKADKHWVRIIYAVEEPK